MARCAIHLAKAAATVAVCVGCLGPAGCTSREDASIGHLGLLGARVHDYHRKYGKAPDALAQLEEFFGSPEEYARALKNPLTGDDPGYLYMKPPAGVLDSSLSSRVVMLYQVRGGERAKDLPVGYAAGWAGPLGAASITDTTAAWRESAPPGSACKLEFPAEPAIDAKDAGRVKASVDFCGLEYGLDTTCRRELETAARVGTDRFLSLIRGKVAEALQVRITSSEAVRCGGHEGLGATFAGADRDVEVRIRWFLVGDRLICLSVSGPKGSLNDDNAGRFFASLELPDR